MRTNEPKLRWTIEQAAREFLVDRAALAASLRQESVKPGKDGKYSTRQVCAGIYTDARQSRGRLAAAQAEREELRLALEQRELIAVADVRPALESICLAIRRVILKSNLSHDDQDRCIKELREIKPDEVVAQAQEAGR